MQILNLASGAAMQAFGARRLRSACSAAAAATVAGVALTTPAAAQTVTYTDAALGYGYFTVNISSPTTISGPPGCSS